jgi:protein-tyrosine-phosphatase/predicted ATP-grasp superfamily ATP-dependent carboligase
MMPRPILVFNSIPPITVAVSRSLFRHGIPVTLADIGSSQGCPASRAIRYFVELPDHRDRPQEFVDGLIKLIRAGGYDSIFPCSDAGLAAVSQHYDRLTALVYPGCPQPEIVERVLNKDQTLEAANACGLLVPKTHRAPDIAALEELRRELRFPVIAKPRSKMDERRHTFKTLYFAAFQNLRDAFLSEPQFGAENLLQEYCSGVGVGVEVLFHDGEPLALFQHRRLKELPVSGGGSVLCISEPLNQMLAELATTLLRKLEWRGVAMVEFRYDPSTQQAVLMEVNGRYWGSLPLAISAGVDFPFYEWQLAHGEEPRIPRRYRIGLRSRWLSADIRRLGSLFLEAPADGFPRPSKWGESVRFVTDFSVRTHPYIWSWSDPLPAVMEFTQAMRPMAATALKRIVRKVRQVIAEYRYLGTRKILVMCRIRALYALRLKRDRPPSNVSNVGSVLFVCQGNKIRSPMAQALFCKYAVGLVCDAMLANSSAGLIPIPEARADERARIVAKEFGVSLDDYRPQHLTAAMIEQADLIFIMDNRNEAGVRISYPHAMRKVFYLGACGKTKRPKRNAEIDDPDRGTLADIRRCYQTLDDCIRGLAEILRQRRPDRGARVAADVCSGDARISAPDGTRPAAAD